MLALGLEQARRRGSGITGLQKQATVAWQPQSSGKPPSHEQGGNIRQKISQWEVRSHQGDGQQEAGVKAHRLVVSKVASADVAEDSWSSDGSVRSRAKSLGLDFRETQAGGERSEVAPSLFSDTWTPLSERKPRKKAGKWEPRADFDLPKHSAASSDDSEDNLPPGNFYTSRGFWRRLEGDKLHWEKGREASGEPLPLPPPKPQRTFQYRAAGSPDGPSAQRHGDSPNKHSDLKGRGMARPPGVAPPPCPAAKANGLSRHKKNRKSFEYEDATRLTTTTQRDAAAGGEARRSGLHHAFSDDNIYEDIVCEMRRENSYENVKLSPMCLPIARPRPWTISQRRSVNVPKLPPKPQTLRGYAGKAERRDSPTPRRTSTPQTQQPPHFVNMIEVIFDAKRGRKRVKIQGATAQEETSGTESDPEDGNKARCRRSVYVQTTLKRRPGYRTLERDLIQLQQQQLFQLFVVVSLRKDFPGNTYSPEITQQFPKIYEKASRHSREAEDRLKAIPRFCFPDPQDWRPSADVPSETFSFVLTGEDGSRWFCYCRKILPSGKGKRLPEVHCIVSKLGCFDLFAKILDEVERRREICPALVHPFMRSVMEAPFPAPGRTITVKSFLPGSGNEVLTLCRPVDSRLEHVDFDSLLQCLSVGRLLQVFASLLLERRVIFIADTLSVLSRCSHAALALLYPFTWQHTFVPVLPSSMLDISCSPTPFLLGALSPCVPQLLELPIEEVLIVNLCADKFVIQLGDEDCILPSKLQAALQQILEEREDMLRQEDGCSSEGQQEALSSLLSEAFVRFFVELVGHYPLHMSESSSGVRELQRDSFRKSHPSRGARQFLQLFMDTQMFAGFIHDKELRKGGDKGLFEIRAAEYLESEPEPEPSSVNKFLKGLGNKIKFLQIK